MTVTLHINELAVAGIAFAIAFIAAVIAARLSMRTMIETFMQEVAHQREELEERQAQLARRPMSNSLPPDHPLAAPRRDDNG